MWTLQEELSRVELGRSTQFRNLTLFPLVRRSLSPAHLDYLLLEDGIAHKKVRITEVNGGISVSELHLENKAELPILLVNGEELIGAKQNRVLNLTILAPAKHTTVIPVSCVEAGRWSMSGPDLRTVNHVMYSSVRAQCLSDVTESMRSNGSRFSDQKAVWRDIAAKAFRLKAKSPTGAMSAIYERHKNSTEEFTRAFTWESGQAGAGFAIGGHVLGLELFDQAEVMRRFFPKLVRSYALDALDAASETNATASSEELVRLLAQIGEAQSFSEQAIGLGKDVRFKGAEVSGAALWAQKRYVHICAFVSGGKPLSLRFDPDKQAKPPPGFLSAKRASLNGKIVSQASRSYGLSPGAVVPMSSVADTTPLPLWESKPKKHALDRAFRSQVVPKFCFYCCSSPASCRRSPIR